MSSWTTPYCSKASQGAPLKVLFSCVVRVLLKGSAGRRKRRETEGESKEVEPMKWSEGLVAGRLTRQRRRKRLPRECQWPRLGTGMEPPQRGKGHSVI